MYIMETALPLQRQILKWDKDKHYIIYSRPHTIGYKKVQCGVGQLMRWDCVKWFIEESIGLHSNKKKQTAIVVAKYQVAAIKEEEERWFYDNDIITPQRILSVKVVPYWVQWQYEAARYRHYPQYGPVEYPGPIQSMFAVAGLDPSSF
jgi:hypothetical protein